MKRDPSTARPAFTTRTQKKIGRSTRDDKLGRGSSENLLMGFLRGREEQRASPVGKARLMPVWRGEER